METRAAWLEQQADGSWRLDLYIQPGAKKQEFAGEFNGRLKLRLTAPPVEGKANAALCAYIASCCGVPKSDVTILSGEASRTKRLKIRQLTEAARARLLSQAGAELD